jgi:hypothetical protein
MRPSRADSSPCKSKIYRACAASASFEGRVRAQTQGSTGKGHSGGRNCIHGRNRDRTPFRRTRGSSPLSRTLQAPRRMRPLDPARCHPMPNRPPTFVRAPVPPAWPRGAPHFPPPQAPGRIRLLRKCHPGVRSDVLKREFAAGCHGQYCASTVLTSFDQQVAFAKPTGYPLEPRRRTQLNRDDKHLIVRYQRR